MTARRHPRTLLSSIGMVAIVVGAAACSDGYEGASFVATVPSDANFHVVAEVLDYSCGSLDCHGAPGRNFRLYRTFGRRLARTDVPCGAMTTAAEVEADYQSAVGLEPEVMAEVVESEADPGRLTLVRKARGAESHKGGTVFPEGSFGDLCLVSWVKGAVDGPSCNNTFIGAPKATCLYFTE